MKDNIFEKKWNHKQEKKENLIAKFLLQMIGVDQELKNRSELKSQLTIRKIKS
jgi:hypothetical protein